LTDIAYHVCLTEVSGHSVMSLLDILQDLV